MAGVIRTSLVLCGICLSLLLVPPVHAESQSPFTCFVVSQDDFTLSTSGYERQGDRTLLTFDLTVHDQALRAFTLWTTGWELIEPIVGSGHVGTAGPYRVQVLPANGRTNIQAIRFVPAAGSGQNTTHRFRLVVRGFDPRQYVTAELVGSRTATTIAVDFAHPSCRLRSEVIVPRSTATWTGMEEQPEFQSHVILAGDFAHAWSVAERERLWAVGLPVPDVVTTAQDIFELAGRTDTTRKVILGPPAGGWTPIFQTDFEAGLPRRPVNSGCRLVMLSAGHRMRWTSDSAGAATVATSVAASRAAQEPLLAISPVRAQMLCVFDDLASAHNLMVQFALRMDATDGDVSFFVGYSTNGLTFYGRRWRSPVRAEAATDLWSTQRLFLPFPGELSGGAGRVAVLWEVRGTVGQTNKTGVLLDDVSVERYDRHSIDCRNLDPRISVADVPGGVTVSKGINVPAYPVETPSGLEGHVSRLRESAAGWVRLEFLAPAPSTESTAWLEGPGSLLTYVDLKHYDTFVDLLCTGDPPIAVLGLLDYGTLPNQAWRSYGQVGEQYRAAFSATAGLLARYFHTRISYWEIWNEPDFGPTFLQPYAYADLLVAVSGTIKAVDPDIQILFGGLGGADSVAAAYFRRVLGALPSNPPPYDIFAIHPYPSLEYRRQGRVIRDPAYLQYEKPTVLAKFLAIMRAAGHANLPIWITEIGWNRAADSSNPATLKCRRISETMVTGEEQASYMTIQFDILFRETAWESDVPSVVKIFWYQYMDVGLQLTAAECLTSSRSSASDSPIVVDWWYGLYSGTDPASGILEPAPNRSACTFRAYPDVTETQACLIAPEAAFP